MHLDTSNLRAKVFQYLTITLFVPGSGEAPLVDFLTLLGHHARATSSPSPNRPRAIIVVPRHFLS